MKELVETILAIFAKLTLALHKPKIVGITGSVGKTSTKDAVGLVLSEKFRVGASFGNLNSQVGLPLSILGFTKSGGTKLTLASVFEWLGIIVFGFFRIFRTNFPEVLVLEMGSDKPGDIEQLLRIIEKLDVAVITDIGISHLEFFPSPEALAAEKLSILNGLDQNGFAILNSDNPKVLAGKNKTAAKVMTYGFNTADISPQSLKSSFMPQAFGKPAIYAGLAAVAVGRVFGISPDEGAKALEKYQQPPGRLSLMKGINNSTIIDDTYNASPDSTFVAIDALMALPGRKLAAIGDMAELGIESEAGHRAVGSKILQSDLKLVFLVGNKTKLILDDLRAKNFKGQVFWFADSDQAIAPIKQNLSTGDAILVKGSQATRMEKIVNAIMANPTQAPKLLVRQTKPWVI